MGFGVASCFVAATVAALLLLIPSEIRKLPSLNVFKTSFHGKDFSNTPGPIVALIIHNVSFCILNILANSFLEYFSLVLNTIPRKTM